MSNFTITEDDLDKPSTRLLLAIQSGDISGAKIISKFGYNFAVGSGAPQTVWDGTPANTGAYQYPLDQTPSTVDISSDDILDVGIEITVEGLDANGNEIGEVVVANGNTPVSTASVFWRIFRAYNSGGEEHVGTISVHVAGQSTDPFLAMSINADSQQSLFAGYTIPLGHTGYVMSQMTSSGKGKEARISFHVRKYGKIFRTKKIYVGYQNIASTQIPFRKLDALCDVEARASADADNTNVSAEFGILLIKD